MKPLLFDSMQKTHSQTINPMKIFWIAAAISLGASIFLIIDKPLFYVVALAGIVVILPIIKTPQLGFYLTAAAIPLDEVGDLGKILPIVDISIVKIFALLTIFAWLIHISLKKMRLVWHPVASLFLLYFLVGALSLIDAIEVKEGLQELIILATTILFFIMTFNIIRTKKQLLITLACFSIVSAGTFAWAGVQRILPSSVISERVGWLSEGEAQSGTEISSIESKSLGGIVKRSTGTTAHSNILGASTAFLLPILFAFLKLSRRTSVQALIWVGIACCFVGAVVSLSRTGILSYLLIIPMLIATRLIIITPLRVILLAIAITVSIPFMPDGVSRIFDPANYFSSKSVSVSERYKLWDAALRAFIDHPVNGFGIGNNRGIFDYYYNPWNPGLLTVHNTYLQILIETGIFGLLVLGFFFYKVIKLFLYSRRMFLQQGDEVGATFSLALLISFICFLIMGGIAFDFMRIGFKNMWLMIACSVVLYNIAVRQSIQRREPVN